MLSIPEIASQIVNKALSESSDDCSRTVFVVGSKSVGKSTMIHSFLEKNEVPRETLVLEYSFGRKSVNKQSLDKSICHVWEYGGKLDVLKNTLTAVPVRGKYYCCVMVDLSKIKNFWNILETCIGSIKETYDGTGIEPELIIIGGKYDIFKNYDNEIKKIISTTMRSVALATHSHLIFYSSKEPQLVKRAKEILYNIGFGSGFHTKEKNTNFSKPLFIPKGSDSWENIGVPKSTMDMIKARHLSRITPEAEVTGDVATPRPKLTHPEPVLDALASAKYDELRNMESFDFSIGDYLKALD
ncbi:cytoplasmic dynein 2 light intermediate chain 1 [Cydia fagiglandana]|uniref:cytoplasmic dynein 2 light intermediate chain 1 n=1 Tax=Cydia fagiglandana TaxID=1458189 RepID=UPI002FEE5B82